MGIQDFGHHFSLGITTFRYLPTSLQLNCCSSTKLFRSGCGCVMAMEEERTLGGGSALDERGRRVENFPVTKLHLN
jgi:hypothetical protein